MTTSTLLGLTSEHLLQSIELQKDFDLSNTLQNSTGLIKSYKLKGTDNRVTSLAEIRREARVKRFVNPHKSESHKGFDDNEASVVSVVTPNPKIDNNKNNCGYRNKFSATPIADDKSDVTASTSKPCSKIHKAVMKRLLDINSPTSASKRKCYRKLAADDNEVLTIINLSIEMDSTVEETKNMIINNYIN